MGTVFTGNEPPPMRTVPDVTIFIGLLFGNEDHIKISVKYILIIEI